MEGLMIKGHEQFSHNLKKIILMKEHNHNLTISFFTTWSTAETVNINESWRERRNLAHGINSFKVSEGEEANYCFPFHGSSEQVLSTKMERNKYVVVNDGEKQQVFGRSTKPGNLAVSRELRVLFSEKVCDSTS